MAWFLRVEAWEAEVSGSVTLGDPDGIVEHVRHVSRVEAIELMQLSPPWIHIPVTAWLQGEMPMVEQEDPLFRFHLPGYDRSKAVRVA